MLIKTKTGWKRLWDISEPTAPEYPGRKESEAQWQAEQLTILKSIRAERLERDKANGIG